jgi:hypothetical protein
MKSKRMKLRNLQLQKDSKMKVIISVIKWLAYASMAGLILAIIILKHLF